MKRKAFFRRNLPGSAHFIVVRIILPDGGPDGAKPSFHELHRILVEFLAACRTPAVLERGEPVLLLREGEHSLEATPTGSMLEVWGETKVLRRRIIRLKKAGRGRLDVVVEQFARKTGSLTLLDAEAPGAEVVERDASRAEDLAVLRVWCERLFPLWRMEQSSCGTDLEHSLSPRFPRAMLRMGTSAMAVLAAPDVESAEEALAFALVWFRHAQARWPQFEVTGLTLFVPEDAAVAMGLRLRALQPEMVRARLFAVPANGFPEERPPQSWGNLASAIASLAPRHPADEAVREVFHEVAARSQAEVVEDVQGGLHLEVRGLPIATCRGERVHAGLTLREVRRIPTVAHLLAIVRRVESIRCEHAPDPRHELYRAYPERWLEGEVRREIAQIDPLLDPALVRRQVAGSLGGHPSRTDLLALDREGRLVILEIKVSEDISLPIQALDYYIRLRLHLERGEIESTGLFPNRKIMQVPPRLLLVAPALQFHPSNETVLRFFESSIWVRQIGVAIEWRKKLRVVFDHHRSPQHPGGKNEWQAISSVRSAKRSPH